MTNREIGLRLAEKAKEERRVTSEILDLIVLGLAQRAYLEHGYSSMFDWLVKGFSYSHSAAFRRIEAARLIRSVPEAKEKLKSGEVNITTLSRAQTMIRAQEKRVGKVSGSLKKEIVKKIENKSSQATELTLLELLPEAGLSVHQETRKVVDENTIRHSMNLPKEVSKELERAKEVLSHKIPNASDAEVLAYALKFLLDRTDPLRRSKKEGSGSISAAASKRVTKVEAKRLKYREANGGCSFRDVSSGKVCGSRYQVQWDHIIPKSMGGSDEPHNLRPLCRQHNLLLAENKLGRNLMQRYWPPEVSG